MFFFFFFTFHFNFQHAAHPVVTISMAIAVYPTNACKYTQYIRQQQQQKTNDETNKIKRKRKTEADRQKEFIHSVIN